MHFAHRRTLSQLMRLLAELKEGQGGWVSSSDLWTEEYINDIEHWHFSFRCNP